jgi:lysophospholipase L1-like esterase
MLRRLFIAIAGLGFLTWALSGPLPAEMPPLFVYEGDSLTAASANPANLNKWPAQLPILSPYFAQGTSHNFAKPGTKSSRLPGEFATQAHTVKPAKGQTGYFFVWAGTNDLARGAAAEAVYENLRMTWQLARADGYKVVAFTVPPARAITGDQEISRAQLNGMILGDRSAYDLVIRAHDLLPNPSNTNLFLGDGTHLTRAGNTLIAKTVAATVPGR